MSKKWKAYDGGTDNRPWNKLTQSKAPGELISESRVRKVGFDLETSVLSKESEFEVRKVSF